MTQKLKILFLCTGNSCRSQMAEGFARHLHPGLIEPYSAGTDPHGLNPRAVAVMKEAGIDISTHTSKHADSLAHIPLDYVITVCDHARETCPTFLGRGAQPKFLHVSFEDPPRLAQSARSEEEALTHYRRVRDQIHHWIQSLPKTLTSTANVRERASPTP